MSRLHRRDWRTAAAAGAAVAAVSWLGIQTGWAADEAPAPKVVTPVTRPAPAAAPSSTPAGGPASIPAAPSVTATSIVIPAIGVSSRLEQLTLDAHGVLRAPADPRLAGWFAGGTVPGDRGPAVIAGHLDSRTGPAIFVRLAKLRPGDLVLVHRSDGRTVSFRVQSTQRFSKAAFPTAGVYGPTPTATLRLITCGGTYDHAKRRYPDDGVVIAEVV